MKNKKTRSDWRPHFVKSYIEEVETSGYEVAQKKLAVNKEQYLPKFLYKFFPPSAYSLINLYNNTIHLSSPQCFNDPFDSYSCIDIEAYKKSYLINKINKEGLISEKGSKDCFSIKEYNDIQASLTKEVKSSINRKLENNSFQWILYRILKKKENMPFLIKILDITSDAEKECYSKIGNIRNSNFIISCFSSFDDEYELFKNTTMWSHYADDHKGFSIKYALNFENITSSNLLKCGLFTVSYSSRVHKLPVKDLLKAEVNEGKVFLNKNLKQAELKTLMTKSKSWSYEKEWRLIINERESEPISNNTISFLPIDTVFLGCKIEEGLKKSIIKFCTTNNIKVYQTLQSQESFTLITLEEDERSIKTIDNYNKQEFVRKNTEDEDELIRKILNLWGEL